MSRQQVQEQERRREKGKETAADGVVATEGAAVDMESVIGGASDADDDVTAASPPSSEALEISAWEASLSEKPPDELADAAHFGPIGKNQDVRLISASIFYRRS